MKTNFKSILFLSLFAMTLGFSKTNKVSADIGDYSETITNCQDITTYIVNKEGGEDSIYMKRVYTNNDQGQPTKVDWYFNQGESLGLCNYTLYTYNQKGLLETETSVSINTETKAERYIYWTNYQYDESNYLVNKARYEYDNNVKEEKAVQYYNYSYNSDYLISQSIEGSETESSYYRSVYTYNDKSLCETEICYVKESALKSEHISYEYIYEYDSDNNLIKTNYYSYYSEGQFYENVVYSYTYENSKLTQQEVIYYSDQAKTHNTPISWDIYNYSYNGEEVTVVNQSKTTADGEYVTEMIKVGLETDTDNYLITKNPDSSIKKGSRDTLIIEDGKVVRLNTYSIDKTTGEWILSTYELVTYVAEPDPVIEPSVEKTVPVWPFIVGGVVVVCAVYVCGYFFLFQKQKLTGKFFETIYNWFTKFLEKVKNLFNKNKNKN